MKTLRLFCPADKTDWSCQLQTEREVQLLKDVASRLELAINIDEAAGKFFLGRSKAPPPPPPGSTVYPSGKAYSRPALGREEAARYGTTGVYTAAPLIRANPSDRLSEHFTAGEFVCHDPSFHCVRVAPDLVAALELIRERIGRPISIHSAYRPPAYNTSIGGVSNSAHIDGLAADISCSGVSLSKLHDACEAVIGDTGGVGYYPSSGFVHIDVRGHRSRWTG